MNKDQTRYSEMVSGDDGSYEWPCRFDMTSGYLGISQQDEKGAWKDRVLLSPGQVRVLKLFLQPRKKAPRAR